MLNFDFVELFKVDITNRGLFPKHKEWWNSYTFVIKNEGNFDVKNS